MVSVPCGKDGEGWRNLSSTLRHLDNRVELLENRISKHNYVKI